MGGFWLFRLKFDNKNFIGASLYFLHWRLIVIYFFAYNFSFFIGA